MIQLSYQDIRHKIVDGDLFLFRGKGWFSKLIQSWTKSPYSHVEIAVWLEHRLCTIGAVLHRGVYPDLLSHKLKKYGGQVEWWAVSDSVMDPVGGNRHQLIIKARNWLLDSENGWGSSYASSRQFWRSFLFGWNWDQPDAYFCSEFAARYATQVLGLQQFSNAIKISPGDFARCDAWELKGIITA